MKNTFEPTIFQQSEDSLSKLTMALNLPREILPASKDIDHVINELPELLGNMREDIRDEKIVKLCLASGVGLFDAAVNYIWDQTVIELRKKIIRFGLDVVSEILEKKYEEKDVNELQDSTLLDICLTLQIINDEGYYYLSQCRDMRNNCSAAHPSIGKIDKYELVNYINRCIKFALSEDLIEVVGISIKDLLPVLSEKTFTSDQLSFWNQRIEDSNSIQKIALFKMLHGKYCDPKSSSIVRGNILSLSIQCKSLISDKAIGEIINCYNNYVGKNDEKRKAASEEFLTKVGLFDSLNITIQHTIISRLCKQLYNTHFSLNNFYNEPPYADYLCFVSEQAEIPDTVKAEFVEVVVYCAVGNPYGVSNLAIPSYHKMVQEFSPKEIEYMIKMEQNDSYFHSLLRNNANCKSRFKMLLNMVNISLLTPAMLAEYNALVKTL